jgi:hypothetical protein
MLVPSASGRQNATAFFPMNESSCDFTIEIRRIIGTSALQDICMCIKDLFISGSGKQEPDARKTGE